MIRTGYMDITVLVHAALPTQDEPELVGDGVSPNVEVCGTIPVQTRSMALKAGPAGSASLR